MKKPFSTVFLGFLGALTVLLTIIGAFILLGGLSSCTSKSGQRADTSPLHTWEMLGYEGDDSYPPIYYAEIQDYLVNGATVFSPEGYVSMSLDTHDCYEIYDVRGPEITGVVSFKQAFDMFLNLHEVPISMSTLKLEAIRTPEREILLPPD